ncbi:MAG: CHAT domain-containing protein [Acidobacteriota bacterium]
MTRRAVFSLDRLQDHGHILRIEEEVVHLNNGARQFSLDLGSLEGALTALSQGATPPGAIGRIGSALFRLLTSHRAIEQQVLACHHNGCGLLIEDLEPEAQALPWETLRDAGGNFLAFGDSPLLGRTVTPLRQQTPLTRSWERKLRVLAVLAASGAQSDLRLLTAVCELEALVAGLSAPGGPPFELLVVGCDFDLGTDPAEDVRRAVEAMQNPAVGFQPLAGFGTLRDSIEAFEPHLLHFFCHGFADDEMAPRLELALRDDQLVRRPRGTLVLEASDLEELLEAQNQLWLLVLNCCLGAAATESISFARDVMARPALDLPAVVAMREAVDRRDAHLFTSSFYREVAEITARQASSPNAADLQWAETLPAVRSAICRERCQALSNAEHCREWSNPVIYVRREPFRVVPVSAASAEDDREERIEELESQIAMLKSLRDELSQVPDIPADKIALLDERIRELRRKLAQLL